MSAIDNARAALEQEYAEACAQRDAVNAKVAPLRAALDGINGQAEQLRLKAADLAAQIDVDRGGGEAWLALKQRIGKLASALMSIK